MTWYSHKALSAMIAFSLTHEISFSVLTGLSAVLPDVLEGKGFLNAPGSYEYNRWRQNHRLWTHWWVIYALLFVAGLAIVNRYEIGGYVIVALSAGCLLHIFEDAVSGKVPGLVPWRKSFGVRLIKTGSWMEKVFTTAVIIIFLIHNLSGGLKWPKS